MILTKEDLAKINGMIARYTRLETIKGLSGDKNRIVNLEIAMDYIRTQLQQQFRVQL